MNENDIQPILIVDDDPANREVLNMILSSDNFLVEEAYDGIRAVEMAGKKQYQLIIIDIRMPRMNGYEAVKKMRKMGITTPIVMQSTLNSKEDITPAFDAGCNEFIAKPYDFKELSRILKKYTIQPVTTPPVTTFEPKDKTQQFLDIAGVLLVVVNTDQTVVLINKKGSEILGYEISEITGKNWFDTFILEKDRDRVKSAFNELIAGNIEPYKYFEVSVLAKNGEEKIIYWHSTVIRDNSGKIVFTLSSGEDITDLRKAEETLRQSEEKYRTLFETMTQGVIYRNAEGYVISANPAAERILRLTLDQMQGKTTHDPLLKTIHEDGTPFPEETYPGMMALKTGKEVRNIIMGVLHHKDNEYQWISINAIPQFIHGEDKPYQVYTTFEDINERKWIEDAQLFLVQCGYLHKGEDFFESLARYLAQNLGMDYVCIDRLLDDDLTAQTGRNLL